MRFLNLTVAAVSLFASSASSAAEWWQVASNGSGSREKIFLIDKESMQSRSSGTTDAWSFKIQETADSDGTRKVKTLTRFDCTQRTTSLLSAIFLGNNNRHISSFNVQSYQRTVDYVVPDSVGEAEWKFVCEGAQDDHSKISESPEVHAARYFRLP